jgi:hypothetical protein
MSNHLAPAFLVSLACAAFICGSGCTRQVYELELTPDGNSIQRTLSVWNETTRPNSPQAKTSPLKASDLARIRPFYDRQNDHVETDRHTFTGRFQSDMPGDIGGAGSYTFFESPLGSTSLYCERFRGNDDLKQSMQERLDAIDKFIGLLLDWVDHEFANSTVHAGLKQLLDHKIRRDLENLSLYCLTHGLHGDLGDERIGQQLMARLLQYFVERDYFAVSDLPRVLRVLHSEDKHRIAGLLHELLIRKLEIAPDAPAALSFEIFRDPDRLESSLRASIKKSELYAKELVEYKRKEKLVDNEPVTKDLDDPLGLLLKYALQATLPHLFSGRTEVRVTLHCDTAPFATNGNWADDLKAVTWKDFIEGRDLPAMAFAVWSLPNVDAQQIHFGRVILDGEDLASFVLAYQSLNAEETKQFDTFLASLSPGESLATKWESFNLGDDKQLTESFRAIFEQKVLNSDMKATSQ